MKNISYILSLVLLISLLISCRDEEKIHIPEFQDAANMRVVIDPAHRQINSTSVATDFIQFDLYSENKDLSLVEIFVHYKNQSHLMTTLTQADFADGIVEDLRFTGADLASWFGIAGFSDGSRGGNFTIRPRVTLNDGRVYPSWIKISDTDSVLNIGTDITGAANGAFTVQTPTAILCPPVDISGSYVVVSSEGTTTDPGSVPPFKSVSGDTVVITPVAGSSVLFNVSDITGGIYVAWYLGLYPEVTGPDSSPGRFQFNCNEVAIVQTTEPTFGVGVSGDGLYDPVAGTITYRYRNDFNDIADIVLRKI